MAAPAATSWTVVFESTSEEAAKAIRTEMLERFPFGDESRETRISAMSYGDAMSVSDAIGMALECRTLDVAEQREFALEMAQQVNWEGCIKLAEKWELRVEQGAFVDARAEQAA